MSNNSIQYPPRSNAPHKVVHAQQLVRKVIHPENINKIVGIFSEFLILWGMLAFVSSHILNVCQKANLRFEQDCRNNIYYDINCLVDFVFSSVFCKINSSLEKTGGTLITALGITIFANSRSLKNLIINYIHA